MNDGLRNTTQEFVNHDSLVVLGDRIKSLLNNMATERVHGKVQGVSANGLGDFDDLFRRSVFKAPLYKKVAETVDHQGIGLCHDGLNNLVLLFRSPNLELLLEKDRGLLIVVANNLVNDVLPVAVNIAVQQTTVVERFSGCEICLSLGLNGLMILVI